MRVAVTGANGFLGSHLLAALRQTMPEGDITGVARSDPVHRVPGVAYTDNLRPTDLLFHLAGSPGIAASLRDPRQDLDSNADLTLAMLEAVRAGAASTIVLCSSCAVYGAVEGPAYEDQPLQPISPYGVSKLAAEKYAIVYHRLHGLDVRVARISNLYGPRQRKLAIYDLAHRALEQGSPLRIRGDGAAVRDFIHAEDAARGLLTIGLRGEPGGVYNVGSGHPVTVRTVATHVAKAAGLPEDAIEVDGQVEVAKVSTFFPSVQRLADLGFQATRPLAEGIQETVDWLRNES